MDKMTALQAQMILLFERFEKAEGKSVKRQLTADIKRFLTYILASNKKIEQEEADWLGELLGREITAEELSQYVYAEGLNKEEFAKTPPELFRKYADDPELAKEYLQTMTWTGREAVVSDGKADEAEIEAFAGYIEMLVAYYSEVHPEGKVDYQGDLRGTFEEAEEQHKKDEKEETLEELLAELDGLIGLGSVKRNVHSLLHLQDIQQERVKRGLKKIPMSNHLVFTGNPGTGKTTVARLIARIYHKIGLLSTGSFVEVDRSGMVAGYVGQTAIEVKNVMDSAKGGVLFIDEAYSLANGLPGDFGMEAIETLLKRMEDDREDMIVIVAGYPDLMEKFISSNPGLRSRFSKRIFFPDYDPDELLKILEHMVKKQDFTISEEALNYAYELLEKKYEQRNKDFANAREVRNMFEAAVVSQADRLYGKEGLTNEELCRLEEEDFRFNEIVID